MTPDEPIAHRRCRLLTLASELGEVAEVGQQMGISRTRSGEGKRRSGHDGLAALPPTARRTPQLRNATPTHVTHELLSRCVFEPTLGCRELADRLGERGAQVGTTTVRTLRNAHGLGRRCQRLARAATIAAPTTALATEAARADDLVGFCRVAAAPGDLLAMDHFHRQPEGRWQPRPQQARRHRHSAGRP